MIMSFGMAMVMVSSVQQTTDWLTGTFLSFFFLDAAVIERTLLIATAVNKTLLQT